MFSELPKIFDRVFMMGYVLPVLVFLGATIGLLRCFGLDPAAQLLTATDSVIGAATTLLLLWAGGLLLTALNWEIFRLMEGYGRFNPVRFLKRRQLDQFKRLLDDTWSLATKSNRTDSEERQFKLLKYRLAEYYPVDLPSEYTPETRKKVEQDKERLMPSAFGNAVRAFEVYPRLMYGIEGTRGWDRLLTVVPDAYIKHIDDAKAKTDMWLNFGFLSVVFLVEYVVLVFYTQQIVALWVLLPALALGVLASNRAVSAAVTWGGMVKAAFDVYLPMLLKTLNYERFNTRSEERAFWQDFSHAFLSRKPDSLWDHVGFTVAEPGQVPVCQMDELLQTSINDNRSKIKL